ncbi:MAG: hypothetical protein N2447_03140 [Thermoanaerobaculum sp.]|nr:hypothetical protein [Thermoanaerobaculum sp.]
MTLFALAAAWGQLPHYVLPVLPVAALWIRRYLTPSGVPPPGWGRRWVPFAFLVAVPLPLVAAWALAKHPIRPFLPSWFVPSLLGVAALLLVLCWLSATGKGLGAVAGLLVGSLAVRAVLDLWLFPALERTKIERRGAWATHATCRRRAGPSPMVGFVKPSCSTVFGGGPAPTAGRPC